MQQKRPKNVIFFVRAYNDLDTQMPLINALSKHNDIQTYVLGYPCDADLYDPTGHEFSSFFSFVNQSHFSTIFDLPDAPIAFRLLQKIIRLLTKWRKGTDKTNIFYSLIRFIHVSTLIFQRKLLKKNYGFYPKVLTSLAPDLIVIDEVLFMEKRSQFIDHSIIPFKDAHDTPIISIKTGQLIYFDPFPNKDKTLSQHLELINYRSTSNEAILLASNIDKDAMKITFPDEKPLVIGNLRMDKNWINYIHKNILPHPKTPKKLNKYLPSVENKKSGPNVIFMLSKIGYGIDVKHLIETLTSVIALDHVTTAIKPHTRGMKLNFLKEDKTGQYIDVTDVPSSELLEWADIVLFTGTGIAFHQMILGKEVGYLKYCQNLLGIFDQCPSVKTFNSRDDLITYLNNWSAETSAHEEKEKHSDWIQTFVNAGYQSPLDQYEQLALKALHHKP